MNRVISLMEGNSDELRERLGDALQGDHRAATAAAGRTGEAWRLRPRCWSAPAPCAKPSSARSETRSLKELMEQGASMYGTQTFEMHIKQLVREGIVDREVGRAAMGF